MILGSVKNYWEDMTRATLASRIYLYIKSVAINNRVTLLVVREPAVFAGHRHIRQETHLEPLDSLSAAVFASSAGDVEREAADKIIDLQAAA